MVAVLEGQRALCVVRDPVLRRTLRRTLNATGSSAEFRDSLDDGEIEPASLVFIDAESRKAISLPALSRVLGENGRVVIIGDSLEDNELIALLRNQPLDHVINDTGTPDENELVVTSVKLMSNDIFGLEKYLSWGAAIHEAPVGTFEEKRAALASVSRYADAAGARRQIIAKVESVTDELLMNALYDAPALSSLPQPDFRVGRGTLDPTRFREPLDPSGALATLRYGCDGRYFALSVSDTYGLLKKQVILDSVLRARFERGRPKDDGGAGLGLYFVLSSVTRFIANIETGKRSEVVCLFDLRQKGRDTEGCARSLHIFTKRDAK